MNARIPPRVLPLAGAMLLLAAAYFALAAWTTAVFGSNPPVRLANAVALVVFLRLRPSTWPLLCAIVLATGAAARAWSGASSPWLAGLVNTCEVLVSAAILVHGRPLGKPWYLDASIPRFLAAWLLVPALSGVAGALLQAPGALADFLDAWRVWYGASALGLLIATPLLLSWTDHGIRDAALAALSRRRAWLVVPGMLLAALGLLQHQLPPLMFLVFPLALLLTWRLGLVGATAVLVAAGAAGTAATLAGQGAIVAMTDAGAPLELRLQMLQLFLVSLVVCSLPFAALLAHQALLARQLRRTGEARSQFLSAMSHEIRTPMTGMLGMVDLLAAEPLTPQQRGFVLSMRNSGRHLLAVVNDVLDFSRIESGKLELEQIDFSIPEQLEQVHSLLHPSAAERGLSLDMAIAPHSPPVVRGDPTRLSQVLLNLVSNAIKFTRQGGVTLSVRGGPREDGRFDFAFEVRDTGIGIAPDKLTQLFAPFTQADRTISREFGGSGLGLAISRRLAEAMGGTLEVQSVPGEGSVFTLRVALALGDPAGAPRRESASAQPVPPRRVLVAEDVEVNREILRVALTREGHALRFAENGAEALALVQQEPFDLVLMDVQMPVMDGVEATRRIRALEHPAATIPIVGLTANVMAAEQARYLGAGMTECLMKPIDWPKLHEALRRHGPQAVAVPASVEPAIAGGLPPAAEAETELLDDTQLATLRAMMGGELVAGLLKDALAGAEAGLARMRATPDADTALREAHKLAGSCGTMGLLRVAEVARRIEEAAHERRHEVRVLVELGDAIAASRAALAANLPP